MSDSALPPAPTPDAFQRWCDVADVVRGTTKRLEKSAALEAYLPTLSDDALATAARFFSGLPFPRHDQRTTSVGGAAVGEALATVTGVDRDALAAALPGSALPTPGQIDLNAVRVTPIAPISPTTNTKVSP